MGLVYPARFAVFKKPFEDVITAENLIEIESIEDNLTTDSYRVISIPQKKLLEEGWGYPENITEEHKKAFKFSVGKYSGNKWGGKHLRAPDIFFTILEKGSQLIEKISEHFTGERYLNTGGADGFFILTNVYEKEGGLFEIHNKKTTSKYPHIPFRGMIESAYLVPLIKDYTKINKKIDIYGFDAYCVVLNEDISSLKKRKVYEYIKWGEEQGYNNRSVTKNQNPWYKPTRQMLHSSQILIPRSFSDGYVIHHNPNNYLSLRFYRLHLKKGAAIYLWIAFLNSTYIWLVLETLGNRNLGQGVLDFFMEDFLNLKIPIVLDDGLGLPLNKVRKRSIGSVFQELGINPNQPIRSQQPNPLPDRKALDDVVFDILGLTQAERDEIYWAVCELVRNRLEKAKSV